jgi:hypothetical protein
MHRLSLCVVKSQSCATTAQRRKLTLKAKFESGLSCSSFKRSDPGAFKFQRGIHRVKLHRPTAAGSTA